MSTEISYQLVEQPRAKKNVHVLPDLIVASRVVTKSVNTASTWSNPANTLIMSALGFAYFFTRTEARKAVNVCLVSCMPRSSDGFILTSKAWASAGAVPALISFTARENRYLVCVYKQNKYWFTSVDFLLSDLQINKVVRAQPAEYTFQACLIWLEEKKLPPETFRFFVIVIILLYSKDWISHECAG